MKEMNELAFRQVDFGVSNLTSKWKCLAGRWHLGVRFR